MRVWLFERLQVQNCKVAFWQPGKKRTFDSVLLNQIKSNSIFCSIWSIALSEAQLINIQFYQTHSFSKNLCDMKPMNVWRSIAKLALMPLNSINQSKLNTFKDFQKDALLRLFKISLFKSNKTIIHQKSSRIC